MALQTVHRGGGKVRPLHHHTNGTRRRRSSLGQSSSLQMRQSPKRTHICRPLPASHLSGTGKISHSFLKGDLGSIYQGPPLLGALSLGDTGHLVLRLMTTLHIMKAQTALKEDSINSLITKSKSDGYKRVLEALLSEITPLQEKLSNLLR